jgi:hypothetical protein
MRPNQIMRAWGCMKVREARQSTIGASIWHIHIPLLVMMHAYIHVDSER